MQPSGRICNLAFCRVPYAMQRFFLPSVHVVDAAMQFFTVRTGISLLVSASRHTGHESASGQTGGMRDKGGRHDVARDRCGEKRQRLGFKQIAFVAKHGRGGDVDAHVDIKYFRCRREVLGLDLAAGLHIYSSVGYDLLSVSRISVCET